ARAPSKGPRVRPPDDGDGERPGLQRRVARGHLLVVRRDARVRQQGDRARPGRRGRERNLRHGLHPRALAGARRGRVPLVAARRRGCAGGRAPGRTARPGRRRAAAGAAAGGNMTTGPAEGFLERLEVARAHMERLATATPPAGALTDAEEPSGERWEWGQVWGHTAEFPAYWTARVREVFAKPASADPAPFGRSRDDPGRLAAIEDGRGLSADKVIVPLRADLDDVRDLLAD